MYFVFECFIILYLSLLRIEKCPYQLPEDEWVDNVEEWPQLEYHDLYHYLIKSPSMYLYYVIIIYRLS